MPPGNDVFFQAARLLRLNSNDNPQIHYSDNLGSRRSHKALIKTPRLEQKRKQFHKCIAWKQVLYFESNSVLAFKSQYQF